jgi:hypothetical protein
MASLIPVCIIGGVLVDGQVDPQELGKVLEDAINEQRNEIANLSYELSKQVKDKLGKNSLVVILPTILPVRDEGYAKMIKDFFDSVSESEEQNSGEGNQ